MGKTIKGYREDDYYIGFHISKRAIILFAIIAFALIASAKSDGITVSQELHKTIEKTQAEYGSAGECDICGAKAAYKGADKCISCIYRKDPLISIYVIGFIGGFLGILIVFSILGFVIDGNRINSNGEVEWILRPLLITAIKVAVAWDVIGFIALISARIVGWR